MVEAATSFRAGKRREGKRARAVARKRKAKAKRRSEGLTKVVGCGM
jgi:hypothetical protein